MVQCELWDWDPGMGIDNDDFLGRSVLIRFCLALSTFKAIFKGFLHLKYNFIITRVLTCEVMLVNCEVFGFCVAFCECPFYSCYIVKFLHPLNAFFY